jgi:hypothetical protein
MIKDLEYGWMVWKVVMILYNYVVQSGDVRKRGIGVGDFCQSRTRKSFILHVQKNVEPCSDLLELLFIRITGGARYLGRTETVT